MSSKSGGRSTAATGFSCPLAAAHTRPHAPSPARNVTGIGSIKHKFRRNRGVDASFFLSFFFFGSFSFHDGMGWADSPHMEAAPSRWKGHVLTPEI